jgi:hypothetical protein
MLEHLIRHGMVHAGRENPGAVGGGLAGLVAAAVLGATTWPVALPVVIAGAVIGHNVSKRHAKSDSEASNREKS